jgi:hypothetical protein
MSALAERDRPGVPPGLAAGARLLAAGELLDVTRRIRDEIASDRWGVAAELEHGRRALIEQVFAGVPPADELPALTERLREVVRLNDELIGLAEHRRRALAREADLVSVAKSALRAYSAVGRAANEG